jgi:diguanylate cyclase (GGDEF)-like protein/PAS domain S-box-containing protein
LDTRQGSAADIDEILAELLATIVDHTPAGIIVIDPGGCIRLVNIEIETLLGYSRAELIGHPVDRLVPMPTRAHHAQLRAAFLDHADTRLMGRGRDVAAERKDGRHVTVEISLRPLETALGTMVVATLVDVSERRRLHELTRRAGEQLERRVRERTAELEAALRSNESLLRDIEAQRIALEQLSREDPLTGLSNRRDFERRLAEEVLRAERLGMPLCVAMFDIDHFKSVNDRFGHAAGDSVLQQVAQLIRGQTRAIDVLARHGGEEFALVMPATGTGEARRLCDRIRGSFHTFAWNNIHPGLQAPVTTSIGLGAWRPGQSARGLLDEADRNLYIAKREGRDRLVHHPALAQTD